MSYHHSTANYRVTPESSHGGALSFKHLISHTFFGFPLIASATIVTSQVKLYAANYIVLELNGEVAKSNRTLETLTTLKRKQNSAD